MVLLDDLDAVNGEHDPALTSPPSVVREFVLRSQGTVVITKVLIANNGMAAVKAIRSIRKWAYETFGDERAIQFTAMCTPEDLKVNAEFIRMADQYVEVPGGTSNNNYSNVDLIVDIAERTGVEAVWVGWGFASENPVLAEKLRQLPRKVVFIGPPPNAMRSLGDKIASTIVAQSAEVPCVSWSGSGLTTDNVDESGYVSVPTDMYRQATTIDADEGFAHAERIGFPVMIKASEGGGGKGIRLVDDPAKFKGAFVQVQREVPGSPVFIMKLVSNSRHLEVQLLADQYGNAIALFGRDCSVQRRHQKIIEEAPITVAPPEVLSHMERAAVRLAKSVGYVSAGTVEYLFEPNTGNYFFLELNPRLQVEHPTTEMVSGVNIPAAQLQIAMGIPLNCIKDIRILYGVTPAGVSEIDFDFAQPQSLQIQRKPSPKGYVIATRITAENPDAGFKPNSGKVLELNFRSNSNVWGYFSVNASGGVHEYADSQFGHIFSYGETRGEARKNLIVALKELSIRGDFRTTVEFLIKLLEDETYIGNEYTTSWLDTLIAKKVETEKPDLILAALCGAVFNASNAFDSNITEYRKALDKGQTPSKSLLTTTFKVDFIYDNVQFKISASVIGPEAYSLAVNGSSIEISAKKLADEGLLVLADGRTHLVYGKEESHATSMVVDGKNCVLEKETDPTKLRSPSPGKLVRYLVDDGAHIDLGEAFAEIEVMKMYMPLLATESGIIRQVLPSGSVLATADFVARLELDDASRVKKAVQFEGVFPAFGPPQSIGDKLHQKYRSVMKTVDAIIGGYSFHAEISGVVRFLVELLRNRLLPYHEALEALSAISTRISAKLDSALHAALDEYRDGTAAFPVADLVALIDSSRANLAPDEQLMFDSNVALLLSLLSNYDGGLKSHENRVIVELVERYYAVESMFDGKRYEDVLFKLRDTYRNDLMQAVTYALAYSKSNSTRTDLILLLLDYVRFDSNVGAWKTTYSGIVKKMTTLMGRSSASLKARELLIYMQMPTYEERYQDTYNILARAVREEDNSFLFKYDALSKLITANYAILDVLPSLFGNASPGVQSVALYTYVLHTYQAYTVTSVKHHPQSNPVLFEWDFMLRSSFSGDTGALVSPVNRGSKALAGSFTDLVGFYRGFNSDAKSTRKGVMCAFTSYADIQEKLPLVLEKFGKPADTMRRSLMTMNVLNVAILDDTTDNTTAGDERAIARLQELLKPLLPKLKEHTVRRVTFLICGSNQFPRYFTFRESEDFGEDQVIRHIEPAMAYQLELARLENFEIKPAFVDSRRLHIYHAVGKKNPADIRFFVRAIVSTGQVLSTVRTIDYLVSEGSRILSDIMDTMEIVSATHPNTDCNHIFINFIPTFDFDVNSVEQALKGFVERHGNRLFKLRITHAEVRFVIQNSLTGSAKPLRFIISSVSGYVTKTEVYQEVRDATGVQKFISLTNPLGPLHNQPVTSPYSPKEAIQPKRYKAHLMGTTYIYDFPELFRRAVERVWMRYTKETSAQMPNFVCEAKELVLDETGELRDVVRDPGINTCGMVAWDLKLLTPEYPEGRHLIVIANDITYQIGSFGPTEDLVFFQASKYARKHGYPRLYISANSGARIGLADEVAGLFKIAWIDEENPSKGFNYLYLTEDDYKLLISRKKSAKDAKTCESQKEIPKSVNVEKVLLKGGEVRYKLIDVIGRTDGLGVENLRGSGQIAGETSLAYNDIFTLSLVTCRSVGIGAYLVRLGQRVIQVEYNPIILTGAGALNKVLGREVYTSNLQLGGTQIMYRNGVSHLIAQNDMNGVEMIIRWLSYVPSARDSPLPVLPPADPVDRDIDVEIPKGPYDPRTLLCGIESDDGSWVSGFFDRGSFMETLAGWAKGVVTGRARLGGIPVGVIAVETRTTETVLWADPASDSSTEQTIQEAGQVWFPNSAFKTAQAIEDFNKGEQLPLIIFANWRGFSGGQSDMYKEILKYGSYIVDALREYKQPVFIYLIGELRGGAWVVVDPTINPDMMEMYADSEARGGVLEPEGIVEIKFRKPQLIATLERLDKTYRDLKAELKDPSITPERKAEVQAKFEKREKQLLPLMHQAAVHFADLHDKPGRMLAKKTISKIVDWREARQFFYFRLLRRISEDRLINEIFSAAGNLLRSWFQEDVNGPSATDASRNLQAYMNGTIHSLNGNGIASDEEEDEESYAEADLEVVRWLNMQRSALDQRVKKLQQERIRKQVFDLVLQDPNSAYEGLISAFKTFDSERKRMVMDAMQTLHL
ncbi:acetyl-CoA carboxylase [Cladochytrium replicatum]|nr:acetyl-CoA carboxylase [Cladochytrium replicatum]